MSKETRAKADSLWLEWGRMMYPYSAPGDGIRAAIALLRGKTAEACRLARSAHRKALHLEPSLADQ